MGPDGVGEEFVFYSGRNDIRALSLKIYERRTVAPITTCRTIAPRYNFNTSYNFYARSLCIKRLNNGTV